LAESDDAGCVSRFVELTAQAAGIGIRRFSTSLMSGAGSTNRTWIVQAEDGSRYVLREYRWPHPSPDDLGRPEKEAWLGELVRSHGVPAPCQLSRVPVDGGVVAMYQWLPGLLLGDIPATYPSAWRSAGEMLARIHSVKVSSSDSAGVIVGRHVLPFPEGSWGQWQLENALWHSALVARRGIYAVDPERVRRLYARAVPLLDSRPVRLLHNDPHPWNILVDAVRGGWRVTGWLDWEFAWSGDPAWDIARLDIFRLKDIGPTPEAFATGYGEPRVPIVSELYKFAIMLWMSNQDAAGDELLRLTYRHAHEYLSRADSMLSRLERAIA
jgi:Ser/Thr protein kinase RdoA (MazF antagonist)